MPYSWLSELLDLTQMVMDIRKELNSILSHWFRPGENFEVWENCFSPENQFLLALSTFEEAFLCTRGEGVGSRGKVLGWGHSCKIFAPHLATFFFRRKEVFFWLRDHGKGLFGARGVRGWGHECQLLGVGSRVPTFCVTSGDESAQRATSSLFRSNRYFFKI